MAEPITYHIIGRRNGWAVRKKGYFTRAYRVFPLKSDALRCAMNIKKCGQIIVHKNDGSVDQVLNVDKI